MTTPKARTNVTALHEALSPYISVPKLRELVANREDLHSALTVPNPPKAVLALIDALAAVLSPTVTERYQIKSPGDVANLLMLEMGHLDQEHLRTVQLDTKNRVQSIVTVYIGSVNSAQVRISEVLREAIRCNSAALIVAHNHPSGDPTPSPEDIMVTRQIIEAGKLLDIDCLDHLVIGKGVYVSMRERGLAFHA